ncbi:MAG: (2Fe-2S) ferredoxin domain-containing protein [Cytophagaceae bacterium]
MKYKKHIFICTNQREDGRQCCGEKKGMELVDKFKQLIKENKLNPEVRAQRAGCLDVCTIGPAAVVYPEGVFYGHVQPEDVKEIFESHILNNKIVERLEVKF